MKNNPLVSVLVTAYNREKYIAEAVESVLKSSYSDFELIVVDDCSTDDTLKVAKRYENIDKRVVIYKNDKNLGQFANRNKAALLAKGEYLKYLDSDDTIYSSGLLIMVESMEKFPEAAIGCENHGRGMDKTVPYSTFPRESFINHYLQGGPHLFGGPSSCIMRKDVFDIVGGFEESYGILADTHLVLKIASLRPVVWMQPDLFFWRRHDDQVTEEQKKWLKMNVERFRINESILLSTNCPFSENESKIILRNLKNIVIRTSVLRMLSGDNQLKDVIQLFRSLKIDFVDVVLSLKENHKFI